MSLIFRYLARETYSTMLVVTALLVTIFMSHQFVHYLGDAATGRLTPQGVFQIMCIQIPLLLGFMLPLGLFLGILLSFGRLYMDNEMTIFTACGVSKTEMLNMSLGLASVVAVVVTLLMLWVEPKMAWYRNHVFARAALSSPIERVSPGRFQTIGDWVLYSEGISRNHQSMAHVFAAHVPRHPRAEVTNSPIIDVVTAESAFQKKSFGQENYIVLANGHRYLGNPGIRSYKMIEFKEYGVRLPNKMPNMGNPEEFMSFSNLWKEKNPIAQAEWQWRIAMPISVIILTLFAVPLSEVKPRKGRYSRLLPAIIIYIVYLDLLFLGRDWIEKSRLPESLGLWWIHGLMLALALLVLCLHKTMKKS